MRKQTGYTAFELVFAIAFVVAVGIGCGVLYTAIHFLSKVW